MCGPLLRGAVAGAEPWRLGCCAWQVGFSSFSFQD